ncbi:MAG: N-acetylglucosamine-6-phosphate deacetylase [Lachnospiraceae bacterium]|nr:N-acetylglucosamine-6-phosphate deacetylase [Lachnospiraceae bacterium]
MVIQGRRIWLAGQFMEAQLVIRDGKIESVLPYNTHPAEKDWGNKRVLPGFLDIHTHGAYGFDTNDGEPEGLRNWIKRLPEEGVTAFLPTTVTGEKEVLVKALKNVAAVAEEGCAGAEILGIHLEGPYLASAYRGAQPEGAIVKASVEEFKEYQSVSKGMIRYVTLAPECDEGFALTKYCTKTGVAVSMGHSGASYEQAVMAVANGAVSMTHVYNGMTGYHHRKPGMVGAAFRLRDLYGEVICDGIHSHPAALNNFFQAKGRNYGIMVSDSLEAKGCPPGGSYSLGGQQVELDAQGTARIAGAETIAGSTLKINEGLRILVEEAMVPFDVAVNSCTVNPARCIGIDRRKGKLAAGYDADLVVLEDDYSVVETYCRGEKSRGRDL